MAEGVTTFVKRGRRTIVVPAPKLLDARVLFEAGKSRDAYNLLQSFGELPDLVVFSKSLIFTRIFNPDPRSKSIEKTASPAPPALLLPYLWQKSFQGGQ